MPIPPLLPRTASGGLAFQQIMLSVYLIVLTFFIVLTSGGEFNPKRKDAALQGLEERFSSPTPAGFFLAGDDVPQALNEATLLAFHDVLASIAEAVPDNTAGGQLAFRVPAALFAAPAATSAWQKLASLTAAHSEARLVLLLPDGTASLAHVAGWAEHLQQQAKIADAQIHLGIDPTLSDDHALLTIQSMAAPKN